jgi:hypothetical protein
MRQPDSCLKTSTALPPGKTFTSIIDSINSSDTLMLTLLSELSYKYSGRSVTAPSASRNTLTQAGLNEWFMASMNMKTLADANMAAPALPPLAGWLNLSIRQAWTLTILVAGHGCKSVLAQSLLESSAHTSRATPKPHSGVRNNVVEQSTTNIGAISEA